MSQTDKQVDEQQSVEASAGETEVQAAAGAVDGELQAARAKADENWSLYLHARADLENARRRAERDVQQAHRFALEKFSGELLPVRDNLERGLQAARDAADLEKLIEGTEMTLKLLGAAMDKFGIREINPVGQRFNPEQHEAMATQPSADAEPNTVLHVVQKGYSLNERLLRPAMVVVARAAN